MPPYNFQELFGDPMAIADKYEADERTRAENIATKGNFTRALASGTDGLQGSVYGGVGLLGDAVGSLGETMGSDTIQAGGEAVRDWGFKGYQDNLEEASLNPTDVPNFTDISTDEGVVETVSDTGKWFAGALGELAPSMGISLVSSLVGAAAGTAMAPGAGTVGGAALGLFNRKLLLGQIDDAVAGLVGKGIAKEVAEATVKKGLLKKAAATLGSGIGITQSTAMMEGGGMWAEDAATHGVENANAGSAAMLGLVSGASELVSPGGALVQRLTGVKGLVSPVVDKVADTLLKRLGTEIPKNMGEEAAQEIFQSFLGIVNKKIQDPTVSLTDREAMHEYFNSGTKGAAGGGLFGGVAAVFPERPAATNQPAIKPPPIVAPPIEELPAEHTVDDVLDDHQAKVAVESATAREAITSAATVAPIDLQADTVAGVLGQQQAGTMDSRLDSYIKGMATSLYPKPGDEGPHENPVWLKLKTMKNWEKQTGEQVKSYVTSVSAKETLKAIIAGAPLTEKQTKVWAYLKSVAENLAMMDEQAAAKSMGDDVPLDYPAATAPTVNQEQAGLSQIKSRAVKDGEYSLVPDTIAGGFWIQSTKKVEAETSGTETPSLDATPAIDQVRAQYPELTVKQTPTGKFVVIDGKESPVVNGQPFTTEFDTVAAARNGFVSHVGSVSQQSAAASVVTPEFIDAKAHEAATSPHNDIPQPTTAQKEAGNYAKGHLNLHGLNISIENPKGSERSGADKSGKAWSQTMASHYGYIKNTTGADKEHIDAFLGDNAHDPSKPVFIVDQVDPKNGKFDEHKILLGASNETEARDLYLSNYEKGWQGIGAITGMSLDKFKEWSSRPSRTAHPVAYESEVNSPSPSLAEHTSKKGKTIKGIVRTDITLDQAKAIDKYTFRKDGGFFIREKYLTDQGNQDRGATNATTQEQNAPVTPGAVQPGTDQSDLRMGRQEGLPAAAGIEEQAVEPVSNRDPVPVVEGQNNDQDASQAGVKSTAKQDVDGDISSDKTSQPDAETEGRAQSSAVDIPSGAEAGSTTEAENDTVQPGQDRDIVKGEETGPGEIKGEDQGETQEAAGKPKQDSLTSELMGMSDDDIATMVNDAIAASDDLSAPTLGEVKKQKKRLAGTVKAGRKAASPTLKQPAKDAVAGMDSVLKGIAAAFGVDSNKLLSFPPGLDEHAYAKARPFFVEGWNNFKAAGKGLGEYVKFIVDQLRSVIPNIGPYVTYYLGEVQGKNNYEKDLAERRENTDSEGKGGQENGKLPADSGTVAQGAQAGDIEGTVVNRGDGEDSRVLRGPGSNDGQADDGGATGRLSESLTEDQRGEIGGTGDSDPRHGGVSEESGGRGRRPAKRVRGTAQPVPVEEANRKASNYRITDADALGKGGAKQKAKDNITAIRILKQLQQEGRAATAEEQAALVKYVGWGASELANGLFPTKQYNRDTRAYTESYKEGWEDLAKELQSILTPEELSDAKASTLNAHYTSQTVIQSMYSALERFGFKGGKVLEPGSGIGNFIGLLPDNLTKNTRFSAIELDPITAGIAKALYPSHDVRHLDYAKFKAPDGFFDVAIGNPPFDASKVTGDPQYAANKFSLHDFFFAKTIDKVRPGGMMVMITSRFTMDKGSEAARKYIGKSADLVGAIRLPNNAFKENAGTEVVTDVLFFRKRLAGEKPAGKAWSDLKEVKTGDRTTSWVNEYYAEHPAMVLGDHSQQGSMYAGAEYTVMPHPGDLADQFAKAVKQMPKGLYEKAKIETPTQKATDQATFAPTHIKEGAYFLDDKGNVLTKKDGVGVAADSLAKINLTKVTQLIKVRDAVRQVLHVQLTEGSTDAELKSAQKELAKQYDAFVAKFGPINKESITESTRNGKEIVTTRYPNWTPFKADPDSYLVAAIEKYDPETGTGRKADIFTKRTIAPTVDPKVESLTDALHVVMHNTGAVDMAKIAALMGVTEEQAAAGLDSAVFSDPATKSWVTSDEYLSGNVREKLELARQAAEIDTQYERNVAPLEAVQPADLPPSRIQLSLGMPIIAPAMVEQFAKEVITMGIKVNHVGTVGDWEVVVSSGHLAAGATSDYGTNRRSAADLISDALNSRSVKVYDWTREDGKDKKVLNKDATEAANAKLQKIKERFSSWMWEDAGRTEDMVRRYNDAYNNTVKREYGGDHIHGMQFPGLSSAITPHEHQKRVAWRIVQQGNTYMAHSVGAGKTIASIIAGMELKRLGIKKKPCWIVPGHMLKQFASEFMETYPAAKILVADEEQFSAENRNRFMGRVAAENWDAVIITHTAFTKIPMDADFHANFIREQLDDLETIMSQTDDRTKRKQIERAKKRLQARLDKIMTTEGKDKGITFADTGIDQIFVDEAQEHRKVDFVTNQSDIKGIDPNGSALAFDLYAKSRYLETLYPNRSLVLMSGTPITNTIGEVYTIQRFLQEPLLKKLGLDNFDAWASTFGDMVSDLDATPGGTYKMVSRFAKFKSLPALSTMWAEIGDFVHAKDLSYITRPAIETGGRQLVVSEQSPTQKAYKGALAERIKRLEKRKGPPKKGDDIILSVITDGNFAALDDRFIDPKAPVDPNSKTEKAIAKVFDIWQETKGDRKTQMIFADRGMPGIEEKRGFSLYKHIKAELVKRGVPAEEIAFMQDYKKSDAKRKLFQDMNRGKVRVLIGSSKAMGTGVNAQGRLIALHHMDPDTYLPANIEQREGRIVRQGNSNKVIQLYAYVTKGSFDETMWQFLESKQRFIDSFLAGKVSEDAATDVDGMSDSFAVAKAMSSDNPLVLEKAGLENEIGKLSSLQRAHIDDQRNLAVKKAYAEKALPELERKKAKIEKAIAKRTPTAGDQFKATVGKKVFDTRKEAGEAIKKAIAGQKEGVIGSLGGGDIVATSRPSGYHLTVRIDKVEAERIIDIHSGELAGLDAPGLAMRLENLLRSLDETDRNLTANIAQAKKQVVDSDTRLGAKFEHADTLADKIDRVAEIERELAAQGKEQTEGAAEEEGAAPANKASSSYRITYGSKIDRVEGSPLFDERLSDIEFFVHQDTPGGYKVSEASTGMGITALFSDKSAAANALAAMITRVGVEKARAAIEKSAKLPPDVDQSGGAMYSRSNVSSWPEDFPNAKTHTTMQKIKAHPDYDAAKSGDVGAAIRLVSDLINPAKIKEMKRLHPNAVVVAPHAAEATGKNAIPRVLAEAFGDAGFVVNDSVVQTNKPQRTKKDSPLRLALRPEFDGKVEAGQEYILLDDAIGQGGTIAELRYFIESNGGKVVNVSALTSGIFGNKLSIRSETVHKLEEKFSRAKLEAFIHEFNTAGRIEALTEKEGRFILRQPSLNSLRDRILADAREAGISPSAWQIQASLSRLAKTSPSVATPAQLKDLTNDQQSVLAAWQDSGLLEIITAAESANIIGERYSEGGKVQGIKTPEGQIYLVPENIEQGNLWPVFLHESGVHVGQILHNNTEFKAILKSVGTRKDEQSPTGEAIRAAYARVPKDTKPEHVLEEVLAYMVESHPETTLVRRVISLIKKVLVKMGVSVDIFTAADFAALADIAVRVNALQPKVAPASKGEPSGLRLSVQDDTADSPLSLESLAEQAAQMGSIKFIKNTKTDSTFLDRVFSTPEYYFKKFAAAGRVLQAALLRRDIRFEKETEILGGFVAYVQKLRKSNKAAYEEANEYLVDTDQAADGFRIKTVVKGGEEDTWQVIAPKWAVPLEEGEEFTKEKAEVGVFTDEDDAIKAMIAAESAALAKEGYSAEAAEAVKLARELTNRGFDIMAADMRKIIAEAKENGLPNPFIGDGKLNEAGRYGVYAKGKSKPIALFATEQEANEMMDRAAQMISYMVNSSRKGEKAFSSEIRAKKWMARHGGTVRGVKTFDNLSVKKRSDADLRPLTVKEALAQMGDLRGIFFPRIREAGEYVLIAKKDGENPIRKNFDIPTVGDEHPTLQAVFGLTTPIGREAKALKLRNYKVTIEKDKSPSEDVFEATNLVTSLDALLQNSMGVIDKNSDLEVKTGQHINQILTMQIADIFKSRGYLSSRLKRLAGDVVWEGYETDMGKALTQYGKNVAAGTAKRDTARAMVLAFSGRDFSWDQYKKSVVKPDWAEYQEIVEKRRIDERLQKNLFRDVRSFMIDILRNDEQADRIMGTLKGLAVIKYLGFRISSAAVNMTNMVQGVPATIAGLTGDSIPTALGRVISAAVVYGKYRSGKGEISAADRAIFQFISEKGWDEAQFNHEAASELRGKLGDTWNKVTTASMFMFGAAEKANRATTLFAAYKAVKEKNPGADESIVWEQAKEISDRAHGIYGKETIPAWARGKFNVLRLTYTFQKFSHNYMLNMLDLGFNKKEYAAASYLLLSPALLAGSTASLAGPVVFALAGALGIGGDDPEEEWYKWVEETFGGGAFARHGIFGVAGVNIRGSLQMNNPMPTTLADLAGPVGGIATDTVRGLEHLFKGELAKGVEGLLPTAFGNMSKAVRESTEGVTTSNYGSVFYGDEPLKADAMDAFVRFISFNPARLSGIREMQWNEKEVAMKYQIEKTGIYSQIKKQHLNGKGLTPEILKTIKKYNERVFESGRRDIKPITGSGISQMLRRNSKASKVERLRAV